MCFKKCRIDFPTSSRRFRGVCRVHPKRKGSKCKALLYRVRLYFTHYPMIMMNHTHRSHCRMWTMQDLTYVRFILYTLSPPQRTTHATLRARGASEARRGGGDGGGDGGHKATYEEARGDMRRKSTSTCDMCMCMHMCMCM